MNPTYEEMLHQPCECSTKCLCNRSHEQFCDGQNCNCWCHKPPPLWKVKTMEILYKIVKGGKVETED